MIKLIYITDTHGKSSNPGSRLDSFSDAVLNKMRYVGEYAKQLQEQGHEVAVLHGGDWLDSPDVSENFVRDFSRIISGYPCKTFGILGNHDIYGYNPDTFNRTAFGVAEGLNTFIRLGRTPIVVFGKVALTGVDSYFDLDKPGHLSDYTDSETVPGMVNIHIVHGMLLKRRHPKYNCTTVEEIVNCNADIVLTGHDHVGFDPIKQNGKIFCNPGSLLRVTAGTGDLRRDVRMAVASVEDDGTFDLEIVNLSSSVARPASEVLDEKKLIEEKEGKEKLDAFMEKMNNTTVKQEFNVYESLKSFCEEENISSDVLDECKAYLTSAEEELGKGDE